MKIDEEDIETVRASPRLIVSYNVRSGQQMENSMIHQYVFGRSVTVGLANGGKKKYRYQGLLERTDAEYVGQSVLMMREKDADDFKAFLHRLKVPYTLWRVWWKS